MTLPRLLVSVPHLIIDGALAVARVIGANGILFAVDDLNIHAGESLERALSQRSELRRARCQTQVIWGYPIIAEGDLSPALERLAQRAAKACPTLALRLQAGHRARHGE